MTDTHTEILDQMQEYAKNDVKYQDLIILVSPGERRELQKEIHSLPYDGRDVFMDARVVVHYGKPTQTPLVISKSAVRRILNEALK